MRVPGGGHIPFKTFLRRLYQEFDSDEVAGRAAQIAYYVLFSLFPFLVFLATLTAYLPLQHAVEHIMTRARALLPGEAMGLLDQHLRGLVSQGRPNLLTAGLLITIWSASRGVDSVRKALNQAYDVQDRRPFWRRQLIAIGMTVVGALLLLVSIALLVAGGVAGHWLAGKVGIAAHYHLIAGLLRWPLTVLIVMFVGAALYYVLPDVQQKFRFITPGSVVSTMLWLVGTWGFGQYAAHFGSYNVTYGSIGGVIVLLTWLYLSGVVFLLGGEINAILEHASREGKTPGEHHEGERTEHAGPQVARPHA